MGELIHITEERITNKIYLIRNKKVMLDRDLAKLYGVSTGNLNKAVKRNIERFPEDFMFQLIREEYESLRFQFGILKRGQHSKFLPYVFTEQGVAMLSSVLNSSTAIQVNIQIIRVFSKIRELLLTHKDVLLKLEQLEKKLLKHDERMNKHDKEIQIIFEALKQLLNPVTKQRKRIGYRMEKDKD